MSKRIMNFIIIVSLISIPPGFATSLNISKSFKQLDIPAELTSLLKENELTLDEALNLPYKKVYKIADLNDSLPYVQEMNAVYEKAITSGVSLSYLEVIDRLPMQSNGITFAEEKEEASLLICLITLLLVCGGNATRGDRPGRLTQEPPTITRPKDQD